MAFTLYSLIQAAILCVNAVAVLHEERFLSKRNGTQGTGLRERDSGNGTQGTGLRERDSGNGTPGTGLRERDSGNVGWGVDQTVGGFGDEPGIKVQLMNLVRSVRTVMRVPLIAVNAVCIVLLLLFG
ncbi:hypothetical protein FQN60_018389 [Etheostoma spectabile]|uniref:Immediate early response 3-interacting protein 1 n=1 Tax=Etheostoma spectabile TaxID=54343 RepID=A0A5J5DHT8_9PERO|nr:hypothetical protein FQN60_018389 [Etheostoma spectabile]